MSKDTAAARDQGPTPAGGMGSVCTAGWVHPAATVGPKEVALLKARIAAGSEPQKTAWKALEKDTRLNVQTNALTVFWQDFDGKGPQGKLPHQQFVELDAEQAYQNALMWLCTDNEQYARNVATLVDAWATTCQKFLGDNAPLEAGWGCASFTRAIELVKHTWPGWDQAVEARWLAWLDRHILVDTCIYNERWQKWAQNNWASTIAECKMQIALLRSDKKLFEEALADWRKCLLAYIDERTGETGETKRDMYHTQFGLGGLVQVAEMAYQQGIDIYEFGNNRLFRALELHAGILNGVIPSFITYPIKAPQSYQPTWEVAFNHFRGRLGRSMPETEKLIKAKRPEPFTFHWGLGTLTHAGSAKALRSAPAAAPAKPRQAAATKPVPTGKESPKATAKAEL